MSEGSGSGQTTEPGRAQVAAAPGYGLGPSSGRNIIGPLLLPVLLAAFATYLLVGIMAMRVPASTAFPGPQFFPTLVVVAIYVLAVIAAIGVVRDRNKEPAAAEPRTPFSWSSLAFVVGGMLGFALLLNLLGWILAAAGLFWCVSWAFGERRALYSLIVGLCISSAAYIAFSMGLGLTLPSGLLGGGF